MSVVPGFKDVFSISPGVTSETHHYIPTSGSPVRIPALYCENIEEQIEHIHSEGIIKESSSTWMTPAVFVKKTSKGIPLCMDYRELNKRTTMGAYPLPLQDEVQDGLAGSTIFSALDQESGFWHNPVHPQDQDKTEFCLGLGMGLFNFLRMSFGLTGAPSSFQGLMNKILGGLTFVTHYIDDGLIHSQNEKAHPEHLRIIFECLQKA